MRSVLDQSAVQTKRVELEYLVIDGLSEDKTVKIAQEVGGSRIKFFSQRDKGLYDALSRGLQMCSGDVVAYINAGDYYHKCAFDVVIDVMENNNVSWITGLSVWYNDKSQLIDVDLPYIYRPKAIQAGLYGSTLPFIQQESTFWKRTLHEHVDFSTLARFRLAGDAYLWKTFSQHAELAIVCSHLGGFRFHQGQLSSSSERYLDELVALSERPTLLDKARANFDKLIWRLPNNIKKHLNPQIFRFDNQTNVWR